MVHKNKCDPFLWDIKFLNELAHFLPWGVCKDDSLIMVVIRSVLTKQRTKFYRNRHLKYHPQAKIALFTRVLAT